MVISGRDAKTLNAAAAEFDFTAIRADVARLPEIEKMYREAVEKVGKIDVLFANAGIYKASHSPRRPRHFSTNRLISTSRDCSSRSKKLCRI